MAISVAQARQICTKAELDLVLQSTTRQIGSLDAKQLRAAIRRSRTLRDKWRDLKHDQTRGTKADNPNKLGEANARSAQKATLFDEVLGRFEKRLSKLEPQTGNAGPSEPKKVTKPSRSAEHRQSRAEVRGKLADKTELLNSPPKPTPAKKKASPKPAATASKAASTKAKPAVKKSSRKPPKRKTSPTAAAALAANSPIATEGVAAAAMAAGRSRNTGDALSPAEKKRNLKAAAAAKATRVSRSGAPRIQGHVSSQGRRNQAKRGNR